MKRNYNDPIYKQWRKSIRQRDNNTCQWPHCASKNKLHAHHICRWVDNPGLRYHINNGITLCKDHHKLISNNEDSYIEFFTKLILNKSIKKHE
jgi:hypothetical protein